MCVCVCVCVSQAATKRVTTAFEGGANSLLSPGQNRQYGRRVTVGDFRPVLITGNTREPSVVWRVEQNLQSAHIHKLTATPTHTHTHTQTGYSHRTAIVIAFEAYCPGCCDALSLRWVIWLRRVAGYLPVREVDGSLMQRTVFCLLLGYWLEPIVADGGRGEDDLQSEGFLTIRCKLQVPFQLRKMSHQENNSERSTDWTWQWRNKEQGLLVCN